MNGADLIARPESLHAPSLVFQILLMATFVLHLVLMNIALGGSILNAVARLRGKEPSPAAKNLPTTIALAVNLGVPPLLFVQVLFGQFFYTSSVLMAAYWIAVVPLLILAYYAAYIMQRKGKAGTADRASAAARTSARASARGGAAWSVVSALLLLAIAFIYVNNMSLMLRYDRWPDYFSGKGGLMLNLSDPTLFPRFLHFAIASLAVASLSLSAWAWFGERRSARRAGAGAATSAATGPEAGADRAAEAAGYAEASKTGLKLFWIFTAVQMLAGLAWLGTLPRELMRLFMGGSAYATILLIIGVLLAVGLLAHGIMGRFKVAAILLLPTLLVMALMRDVLRSGYLAKVFSVGSLELSLQVGPIVLFLAAFAVGIGIIAWMIKAALK